MIGSGCVQNVDTVFGTFRSLYKLRQPLVQYAQFSGLPGKWVSNLVLKLNKDKQEEKLLQKI